MIKLLNEMAETHFWDNWDRKFKLNSHNYIDPSDPSVAEVAASLKIPTGAQPVTIATDVSEWINKNHKYDLEKKWREPSETLSAGKGDCEDYTFLLASLLPHFGVTEFDIVTGEGRTENRKEFHVWLEVDGTVIDPTADGRRANHIEYVEELAYSIETEEY